MYFNFSIYFSKQTPEHEISNREKETEAAFGCSFVKMLHVEFLLPKKIASKNKSHFKAAFVNCSFRAQCKLNNLFAYIKQKFDQIS